MYLSNLNIEDISIKKDEKGEILIKLNNFYEIIAFYDKKSKV
jgi:hypothetical protein